MTKAALRPILVTALLLSGALAASAQTTGPATQPADSPQKQSMKNLRSLMQAVMMYANDNRGYVPADITHLGVYAGGSAESETPQKLLINPRKPELKSDGYVYLPPQKRKISQMHNVSDRLAIYEAGDFGDGVNVAFWDGHAEFIHNPERFKKLLADAEAAAATQPSHSAHD